MKKILYTALTSLFMLSAFADYDFTKAIENSTMPTDEEIWAAISKYNFSEAQKQVLFKDIKKQLQIIYSSKDVNQINKELNQNLNQVKNGSMDNVIDPAVKKELLKSASKLSNTSSDKKTNTDSASTQKKQRKYGPREDWNKKNN